MTKQRADDDRDEDLDVQDPVEGLARADARRCGRSWRGRLSYHNVAVQTIALPIVPYTRDPRLARCIIEEAVWRGHAA